MRFVRACGGEADGYSANPIAEGFAMLAERRWAEAVAFLLIGQELKFAEASQTLFELLGRRGFGAHDLAFFAVHGIADLEHGRQAINLLLDRVHTRDEQELCIAAAGAGARHWLKMHGGSAKGLRAG
jgi:hypothetical protein